MLAGCGGDGSDAVDASPSPDVAQSWPAKWCDTELGMTADELIAVMGPPTDRSDPSESTNPQLSWYAYEFGFTAFLRADGTTRQLDVNTATGISGAQLGEIHCEYTRID